MMHKAITNCVVQHRLPERSSQGTNHLKCVISNHGPVTAGTVETEREMSALNSTSQMTEYTRKTGTKDAAKDGASYPDPEQIPKIYLVGEETRSLACSFLFHWVEHLLFHMRDVLRKLCEDLLHFSLVRGREGLFHRRLPKEEKDWEAQAGSSAASAVTRNQSACHIPIIWCPCPRKGALEEKPITVRCSSGTDFVGKEHGILPLPGWPGIPEALGYAPVSSSSHLVLLSRGMREIVCIPILVGVVTEVMVRLPLFSWVLEKLMSQ